MNFPVFFFVFLNNFKETVVRWFASKIRGLHAGVQRLRVIVPSFHLSLASGKTVIASYYVETRILLLGIRN